MLWLRSSLPICDTAELRSAGREGHPPLRVQGRAEYYVHRKWCKVSLVSNLDRDFGQNLDAADARGNPKISAVLAVFHPHHRGPATYPLLDPMSQFGRQDQDHFQLAPRRDSRVGVKKNSTRVQIAGEAAGVPGTGLRFGGLRIAELRLVGLRPDRDWHARGKALSGAAFALGIRHENWSLPQTQRAGLGNEVRDAGFF
jgi:hypothetical protein